MYPFSNLLNPGRRNRSRRPFPWFNVFAAVVLVLAALLVVGEVIL